MAPAVRACIAQRLRAVEASHGVRVLYACESGSRAWGFASPDSDYDVRFLYVHPLPWYLQVSAQRDVIEPPLDGLFDLSGWELRKALQLLKKGNATLAEWLDSPIVYRADASFVQALRAAARQVHQPARAFRHYLHLAHGQHRDHLRGEKVRLKKLLYVLRPLLAAQWIERGLGPPPMALQPLLDALPLDDTLRAAIDELLRLKHRASGAERAAPAPVMRQFIESELERLARVVPPEPAPIDVGVLDRLLFETISADAAHRADAGPAARG